MQFRTHVRAMDWMRVRVHTTIAVMGKKWSSIAAKQYINLVAWTFFHAKIALAWRPSPQSSCVVCISTTKHGTSIVAHSLTHSFCTLIQPTQPVNALIFLIILQFNFFFLQLLLSFLFFFIFFTFFSLQFFLIFFFFLSTIWTEQKDHYLD
jgi:hypothetical protein